MVIYTCPRCHYETGLKANMRKHYNIQKVCKRLFSRISINDCLEDLNKPIEKKTETKLRMEITELNKIKKEDDKPEDDKPEDDKQGWIYLIHEREFIKTNEDVYKVGKTLNPKQRLSSYPKGSIVLFLFPCINCDKIEKEIINLFEDVFTKRNDIGNEYFEGDYMNMCQLILPKLIK
jgi:hypothetical protein